MLTTKENAEFIAAEKIVSKYKILKGALLHINNEISKAINEGVDIVEINFVGHSVTIHIDNDIRKMIDERMIKQGYNVEYMYYNGEQDNDTYGITVNWKLEKDKEETPKEQTVPEKMISPVVSEKFISAEEASKLSAAKMNQHITDLFCECNEKIMEAIQNNKNEMDIEFEFKDIRSRMEKKLIKCGFKVKSYITLNNKYILRVIWELETDENLSAEPNKIIDMMTKRNMPSTDTDLMFDLFGNKIKTVPGAPLHIKQEHSESDVSRDLEYSGVDRIYILEENQEENTEEQSIPEQAMSVQVREHKIEPVYLKRARFLIDHAKLNIQNSVELKFNKEIDFYYTVEQLESEGYKTKIDMDDNCFDNYQGTLTIQWT